MGIELTVRMGGAVDSDTKDYTPQLRVFAAGQSGSTIFSPGNMFDNGASAQWQFVVDDDSNEIYTEGVAQLAGHNLVIVTEDASGDALWLGHGRIVTSEVYRGDLLGGVPVQWLATVDDVNSEIKGLALVEAWVRGAESGRDRVIAALAAFCAGDPRLTTEIDDHLVAAGGEVTMPAKTYRAGTPLSEIFDDCAQTEGKVYAVVIHHSGGSHACFQYIDEEDHTTYASTLSITDQLADANHTTVFLPIWDQGPAAIHDSGDVETHIVSRFGASGDAFVVFQDIDRVARNDYWAVPFDDSVSATRGQAIAKAQEIHNARKIEHITHQVSIKLAADKVHLVEAGMSIGIRSAASMGGEHLGTTQTRRIAQIKKEPVAPEVGAVVGHYIAHIQLDRPIRVKPLGHGVPPIFDPPGDQDGASVHSFWSTTNDDSSQVMFLDIPSEVEGRHLLFLTMMEGNEAVSAATWRPAQSGVTGVGTGQQSLTLYRRYAAPGNVALEVWELNNPTSNDDYAHSQGALVIGTNASGYKVLAAVLLQDATGGANGFSEATGTGTAATADTTTTVGDLVLSLVGAQTSINNTWPTYTPGADQTEIIEGHDGRGSGPEWFSAAVSQENATTTTTTSSWTLSQSTEWGILNVKFAGPTSGGQQSEPIGDSNDAGGSGDAAHRDHTHAHGYLPGTGPYHAAHGVTYDNTDTELDAGNVQDAIDELAELVTPISGFVTTDLGGKHQLNVVAASGSTETLDLADGNVHDVTLTDDCTFAFAGATGGVGLQFWLFMRQDGTGGRVPTFPGSVIWPNSTEPSWSTDPDAVDVVEFLSTDGGTTWFGDAGGGGASSPSATIWRPVMAFDVGDDHWYVVVDGDGTAVMAEG